MIGIAESVLMWLIILMVAFILEETVVLAAKRERLHAVFIGQKVAGTEHSSPRLPYRQRGDFPPTSSSCQSKCTTVAEKHIGLLRRDIE